MWLDEEQDNEIDMVHCRDQQAARVFLEYHPLLHLLRLACFQSRMDLGFVITTSTVMLHTDRSPGTPKNPPNLRPVRGRRTTSRWNIDDWTPPRQLPASTMARQRFPFQSSRISPTRAQSTEIGLHFSQTSGKRWPRAYILDQHQLFAAHIFTTTTTVHPRRKGLSRNVRCGSRKSTERGQQFGHCSAKVPYGGVFVAGIHSRADESQYVWQKVLQI